MKVWSSDVMELYRNEEAVPRYIGFRDNDAKDSFLKDEGLPRWETLKETSGRENSRTIEVPPGTRWIRIAENEASGWKYRVADSAPDDWRNVLRAPDASMLLPLDNPSTDRPSTVLMEYDPPLRKEGFIASATALVLTIGGAWIASRSSSPGRGIV